jgi:hypothetical protein
VPRGKVLSVQRRFTVPGMGVDAAADEPYAAPMRIGLPWWAATVLGGLAWIPVRLGVSVAWSTEFLRLSYVRWNMLMVVPLGLLLIGMAAVALAVSRRGGTRGAEIGAWVAVAGMVGMLAGVIVEFWIFGGLIGDRDGAILGWLIYLFAGVLVHVIGLGWFGVGAVRTPGWDPRWRGVGALALLMAALHVAWLPAGSLGSAPLIMDQVLIGLAWVAIGLLTARR